MRCCLDILGDNSRLPHGGWSAVIRVSSLVPAGHKSAHFVVEDRVCTEWRHDHIEWLTSYVNSAVRYGVNMPLEISLDLRFIGATEFWTHTVEALMKMRNTESHSDDDSSWYDAVEDWVAAERGASTFLLLVDYARLLGQHLESLTGKTGDVACRWRSFTLSFEPDLFATIGLLPLTFLHHPTPLLESFILDLSGESTPLHLTTFLPITPRLRSVRWYSIPNMNLAALVSCKSQVANLQIRDIQPAEHLAYTMLFPNIHTLSLHFLEPHTVPCYLTPIQTVSLTRS